MLARVDERALACLLRGFAGGPALLGPGRARLAVSLVELRLRVGLRASVDALAAQRELLELDNAGARLRDRDAGRTLFGVDLARPLTELQ
jgi:hypothetical protein